MRTRRSRAERHEQLLTAALEEFAASGPHLTTAAVAERAGVSQPYLFRFFPSKQALICAAVDRCFELSQGAFEIALAGGGAAEQRLTAMGTAYVRLLRDSTLLQAQLQAFAACRDPAVRAVVRRRFKQMLAAVERASGAPRAVVHMFVAHGMLLTLAAAAGADDIPARPAWADRLDDLCSLLQSPRRKKVSR